MLKFDVLDLNSNPLSGNDPLETLNSHLGEEGIHPANAGSDASATGWASLGSQFGDQGFDDFLFGADGYGGAVATGSAGNSASAPAYAAYTAWMDGVRGFGDDATGFGSIGFDEGAGVGEMASDNAPAQGGSDVMVVGGFDAAKGGNGNGRGGGGGGDGDDTSSSDPSVLNEYLSGGDAATSFNIKIDFKGNDWTVDLQQDFIDAADLLSSIITGDIQDVFFRGKVIDDIVIKAELTAIDGLFGILGQAGPTAIRTDGYLPATAIMQFDIADAAYFDDTLGLWDDIVFHEMMHSIGFGTVWSYQGLLSGGGTDDPRFTGDFATQTYETYFTDPNSGGVPLESGEGPGTDDSHWDEELFVNEIMTGFINLGDNVVSDMTVATLEDMGYETVWDTSYLNDGNFLFA